jgi:hypothetical protein
MSADLKAVRLALGKAVDTINELEGQVNELTSKQDTIDIEETVSPSE